MSRLISANSDSLPPNFHMNERVQEYMFTKFSKTHLDEQTNILSNSYTMGCPPVCVDNPQALVSGLSYVQVDNPWYNHIIPPTSV